MAIDALIERVEKLGQVEVDLKRLDRMLQAAHRSSIDIKDSYDFYVLALKEFNKENIAESYLYHDRARYELTAEFFWFSGVCTSCSRPFFNFYCSILNLSAINII